MRRSPWPTIILGVVFISLSFGRPQQQTAWLIAGAALILIGVIRLVRLRGGGAGPSNDSTSKP